jgi:dihydrofolate reductase
MEAPSTPAPFEPVRFLEGLPVLEGYSPAFPAVSLIAALNQERAIGAGNRLPWHFPEDLRLFREITRGQPVVLGRLTYESIGRLLPGRMNVIVSRQSSFRVEGAVTADSLAGAILEARRGLTLAGSARPEVFVLGGGQIYREALPAADRLYLTRLECPVEKADAFFPDWEGQGFERTWSRAIPGAIPARLELWEKKTPRG